MKDNEKEVSAEIYATADPVELPENAFRELGADEHYRPIMHPAHDYKEVTPYSVGMGLLLAVIFSAAAAYLGLRAVERTEKGWRTRTECDNPVNRSMLWSDCGGSNIHSSVTVHPPEQLP